MVNLGFGKTTIITEMQEMTGAVCHGAYIGDSGRLRDTRDGTLYWVTRLNDGNCWMTQNLDLELIQGKIYTSNDTDLPSGTTFIPAGGEGTIKTALDKDLWPSTGSLSRSWDPALGGDPTYCNDGTTAGTCKQTGNPTTSINDGHDAQGNYYSWGAATAGQAASIGASGEATQSICPKGWRLPFSGADNGLSTTAASGSFGLMLNAQSVANSAAGFTKIKQEPLYFVAGGRVNDGSLNNAGSEGRYWSSTAYNATSAYGLIFTGSSVNPSSNNARYVGVPVRCVAR